MAGYGGGYSYITRKQAGIVYAAVKRGDVEASKQFVRDMYDIVGISRRDLDPEGREIYQRVSDAVGHIVNGQYEDASRAIAGLYEVWVVTGHKKVLVTEENEADFGWFYEVGEYVEEEIGEWRWVAK